MESKQNRISFVGSSQSRQSCCCVIKSRFKVIVLLYSGESTNLIDENMTEASEVSISPSRDLVTVP